LCIILKLVLKQPRLYNLSEVSTAQDGLGLLNALHLFLTSLLRGVEVLQSEVALGVQSGVLVGQGLQNGNRIVLGVAVLGALGLRLSDGDVVVLNLRLGGGDGLVGINDEVLVGSLRLLLVEGALLGHGLGVLDDHLDQPHYTRGSTLVGMLGLLWGGLIVHGTARLVFWLLEGGHNLLLRLVECG